MENRIVGYLIIGIAVLIGFIIFSFNKALTDIVSISCSHGPECPMWGSINFKTNVSIGVLVFIVLIGLYLIFFGKDEKIIKRIVRPKLEFKKVTKQNYKELLDELKSDEKRIFEKIIESEGTVFQSELVEKTGFNKAKVTRLLDKLEGKGIIERRRRGMTNVIILKH